MQLLADSLDYPNFKDAVDRTPGQRHKPCHEVWEVMAKVLGAFGRAGRMKRGELR